MFTGIVDHTATITQRTPAAQGLRLSIHAQFDALQLGESIAVDGICLTVIDPKPHEFSCELSSETLDKTMAVDYRVGTRVNVERSMRASDRFGGHYVTGHIDGTCVVESITVIELCRHVRFTHIPAEYQRYLMPKGSITIAGVSLTINAVFPGGFEVMLIPHTCEVTTLNSLIAGSRVNIEYDWMIKAVAQQMAYLTMEGVPS